MTNEAFARVKIDALLAAQGWDTLDTNAVRFEVQLPDGTRADSVLCDRHGRSLAVIEAKRYSVSPGDAAAQAKAYAQQLGVPYAFLCNGNEVLFWEWQREAYPRPVKTIFKQDDLERRLATQSVRRDPASVAIDRRIVERDYQIECIDTLCREIGLGRRKLLVEMATGTGKTRTAAAFIKRLFEANAITRVLFLVDRIPLAKQTEDAFAEHLADYPAMWQSAAEIYAFDLLIQNPDRRPDNPNLQSKGDHFAIFDHEMALVTEGVLFWRPPWEAGALDALGAPARHVLHPALRGSQPDLARLVGAWEAIGDARLATYRAALPPEWTPGPQVEHTADTAIDFLRDLRDHIHPAMREILRTLA